MKAQYQAIREMIKREGEDDLWLDLRSFKSEGRLISKLFGNPTFTRWAAGNHNLHLFLDSLDECLLRIDTVGSLLIDELKEFPIERLYLRIACPTAEWPRVLEVGLRDLWGNERFKAYELAPLRRKRCSRSGTQ